MRVLSGSYVGTGAAQSITGLALNGAATWLVIKAVIGKNQLISAESTNSSRP